MIKYQIINSQTGSAADRCSGIRGFTLRWMKDAPGCCESEGTVSKKIAFTDNQNPPVMGIMYMLLAEASHGSHGRDGCFCLAVQCIHGSSSLSKPGAQPDSEHSMHSKVSLLRVI